MTVTREGPLLRVTLDSATPKNLLSIDDCAALSAAVRDAAAHAVLIDSKGTFFCGGLEDGVDPGNLFEEWNGAPVVVAVQGPALDDGVAILACAHIVVAAQGTSFALTSNRSGVFPSRLYRALKRAVGARRAMELALSGRVFTAQEALSWGLVHHVAPAFEFDDRAESIAASLASNRICLQDVL